MPAYFIWNKTFKASARKTCSTKEMKPRKIITLEYTYTVEWSAAMRDEIPGLNRYVRQSQRMMVASNWGAFNDDMKMNSKKYEKLYFFYDY